MSAWDVESLIFLAVTAVGCFFIVRPIFRATKKDGDR